MANNQLRLKLFFLKKMPMGFLSGMRVIEISQKEAIVSVPFNYLTKNPFHSVYFAVQAMAAELSTGAMAMAEVMSAKSPVSMLVIDMQATFLKKARSKIFFICNEGKAIADAVRNAIETNEAQIVIVKSIGKDTDGEIVSEFQFTWTFKSK
ncbi:MAG: hypothetical protein AUJ98_08655 [Bacteroidetes bacterium CG2_30_33_31]|nr:MAG: hypothetical protein AUJ98_08655 [Bacteroidetes bacterium CG2_30_33_31]